MVEPSGAWSKAEVETFFRETAVPLRLSCRTPGGDLWMLSLWFVYRDGDLLCATKADADVVRFLDGDDHVAFEVSTNDPPYRGVRGNGTATVEPDPEKAVLRTLLDRYLGGTDSSLARSLLDPDRAEVTIRIEPRRLHSWDFRERMRDVTPE